MRIFSYLYHLLLALFMLGVSVLAWTSGTNLYIAILPWEGDKLRNLLLIGALAGLLSLALAVMRILPVLFLVWSLVVFVMLFRGYVFSPYQLSDGGLMTAVWMTLGALLAIVGAYLQVRTKPAARYASRA